MRQIEYLVAAADAGSVAGAALRLNVAQPSVSAAIGKLEQQIGVELFVRHHAQGVSLTPAGRRLLATARSLLVHAEDWQRQATEAGTQIVGELGVAAFATLAPTFMPALITEFRRRHPKVSIRLIEGTQDALIDGLREARFELALLYEVDLPGDLAVTQLASFDPYVLLPAGHRLAKRRSVPLQELAGEPMVLLDVTPSRAYFTRMLRRAGVEPKIAFSSPSLELVRGLVARGFGYSLLVTRPHGDHAYEGLPLAIRPIRGAAEKGLISLARLAALRPTRLVTTFSDFCSQWFACEAARSARRPLKQV